ncbi:MAG: type II toxin-antitoxin system ParD family antitoxin [Mesorhizobium sp.]|nr:type II toxin-antitoxin system ParD family antitoxin [Mesorhizobium sp.]
MDVSLNAHWEAFVASLVEDGRYGSARDVLVEGLRLVEERETKLAALRETLDGALVRGGSHTDDEVAAAVTIRLAQVPIPDAAE